MIVHTFLAVFAFIFGAIIGSFLNVCIARWPRDLSVVRPRSRCPYCGHQLTWYENIPLVSWLALRARCRCCDEPISAQYPAVELTVAMAWLLSFSTFGLTLTTVRVATFFTILLGVALTDLKHYVIPDGFTVFGLFFMLATSVVALFLNDLGPFAGPYDSLIGACAGAGLIAIVGWLGEVALKREAMGMGDVTLMAFAGAALGPSRAIVTVFGAALLGAITFLLIVVPMARARHVGYREQTELALGGGAGGGSFEAPLVPFGVFLAPVAFAMLLWGNEALGWLLRG
jgi:leader peptidase (prepilin peptidase) / N-methyltransferase